MEAFGVASPGKFTGIEVEEGDEIMIVAPGGGGYGSPLERPVDDVVEDVREGLVSIESARRDYGVVVEAAGGRIELIDVIRERMAPQDAGPAPQHYPLRKANAQPSATTGQLRTRTPQPYETEMITCDVCGKVMPSDYWEVVEDAHSHRFCDAACERLYRDYWLPRYRTAHAH